MTSTASHTTTCDSCGDELQQTDKRLCEMCACRHCGQDNTGGEGYDGYCGSCADRFVGDDY